MCGTSSVYRRVTFRNRNAMIRLIVTLVLDYQIARLILAINDMQSNDGYFSKYIFCAINPIVNSNLNDRAYCLYRHN